ncbi:MAG: hypothetical protein AAFQ43_12890, partial [Bacteroidota bacterium]
VIGGAEELIRGQEESACIDPEQTPLATFAGGAFAGLIGYIVARQVFPEGPRTDLVIPLTPLSRFADAPREGVGLWRPR